MAAISIFSAVKPLYLVSKVLGLTGSILSRNPQDKSFDKFYRNEILWQGMMIVKILFFFVFRMIWNFVLNRPDHSSNVIVTTTLSRILLYGACLISLILGATVNRRKIVQILEKIGKTDVTLLKDIGSDKIYSKTCMFLWIEICALIVVFGGIGYYDVYVWGSGYNFIFEIMDDYAHFINVMVTVQLVNFVQLLKHRFKILNEQLSKIISLPKSPEVSKVIKNRMEIAKEVETSGKVFQRSTLPVVEESLEIVNDFSRLRRLIPRVPTLSQSLVRKVHGLRVIHSELYDASELVNEKYGFPLLMELTYDFIDLVSSLYFTMDVVMNNLKEMATNPDSVHQMLSSTVWAVVCVVKIVSITSTCHTTSVEAQRTAVLVHKLLLVQHLNLDTKSELQQFAAQLSNTKVEFTANGFFSINFALLYGIIEASATYIIILLQFRS